MMPILVILQNADDAGAQTVKFCFDNRQHQAGQSSHHLRVLLLAVLLRRPAAPGQHLCLHSTNLQR